MEIINFMVRVVVQLLIDGIIANFRQNVLTLDFLCFINFGWVKRRFTFCLLFKRNQDARCFYNCSVRASIEEDGNSKTK